MTKAELLERLKANPKFVEAKPATVIIVGIKEKSPPPISGDGLSNARRGRQKSAPPQA